MLERNAQMFFVEKKRKLIYRFLRYDGEGVVKLCRYGDMYSTKVKTQDLEKKFYIVDEEHKNYSKFSQFFKTKYENYNLFEFVFLFDDDVSGEIQACAIEQAPDNEVIARVEKATNLFSKNFFITEKKKPLSVDKIQENMRRIADNLPKNRRTVDPLKQDGAVEKFNIITPDPKVDDLESIILHPQTRESIDKVLLFHEMGDFFIENWSSNRINQSKKTAINFYGAPGTGKTIVARAIAQKLGRNILQVDFSSLISKYVGETGKHIQRYFEKASKDGLVLFFDEADTLLQRRSTDGAAHHMNENQNIFMQELDKYEGILITTTNHFENYDPAQFRRFEHVEFLLPTEEMRYQLIEDHIPKKLMPDAEALVRTSKETEGFSGGDIRNLITNAIKNLALKIKKSNPDACQDTLKIKMGHAVLSEDIIMEEVRSIQRARTSFNGKNLATNKKAIGLAR